MSKGRGTDVEAGPGSREGVQIPFPMQRKPSKALKPRAQDHAPFLREYSVRAMDCGGSRGQSRRAPEGGSASR